MEYRKLPRGGEQISALGLGSGGLGASGEREIIETVRLAVEQGVNYFDVAAAESVIFPAYGKALAGARDKVYLQVHFGAEYTTGKYGWTTKLSEIKRSVDCQPCPAGLDIALINKYYDLAGAGDSLARGHYEKLERKAGDCTACGHCDRRCPFHVPQSKRMEEIRDYFNA